MKTPLAQSGFWLAVLWLAGAAPAALRAQTPAGGPPGPAANWALTFEDNFNSFDATKWVKRWACGNGNAPGCTYQDRQGTAYEDANVTVSNGLLNLRTERRSVRGNAYTSGVVTTGLAGGFQQRYGYFEVRMKPASTFGNDPDFWIFPLSPQVRNPSGQLGQYKELDIAEFAGGRQGTDVGMTIHMPFQPNQTVSRTGTWNSAFHLYGLLWDATKMVFYIDGVEVGRITTNVLDEAGVLILSDEIGSDTGAFFGNPANGAYPATTQIDWVRVWRSTGLASAPGAGQLPGGVYPNPAAGRCTVAFTAPGALPVHLAVRDAHGRQVLAQTAQTRAGENQLLLNTAGWAPGLYTVQVLAGAQQLVQKLAVE